MDVNNESIFLGDFCPWNRWEAFQGHQIEDDYFFYQSMFERDLTTGKIYLHQDPLTLRIKNIGLLVWTAVAHICQTCYRIFEMLTLYHFCTDERSESSLSTRLIYLCEDALKVVATPILVALLDVAILYGFIFPREGRKVYASIERFASQILDMKGLDLFGRSYYPYCAPCYQPGFGMDDEY